MLITNANNLPAGDGDCVKSETRCISNEQYKLHLSAVYNKPN